MDLLMKFKWMWRRRKQKQNCAALLYLSTRADILKRVNHRNLRCCELRCKTVSGTLRGAGKSRRRTVLPCPPSQLALTYWNVWITETCAALPCMGCVACVSMCARPYSPTFRDNLPFHLQGPRLLPCILLKTSRPVPGPSHSPLQWTYGTLSCRAANRPSHHYFFRGVCIIDVNTWRTGSVLGDKTLTLLWLLARWDHVTSRVS